MRLGYDRPATSPQTSASPRQRSPRSGRPPHAPNSHAPRTRLALAALAALGGLLLACGDDDPTSLTVVTHESFDVNEALIEQFEDEHNVSVTFIAAGDANEVVNRAVLNAGNPEGDVLFGVDNLSFHRAVEAGVFSEFRAERRDKIPADLRTQFGDSLLLTPVDFGFVNLNFDAAAGDPPQTPRS